MKYNDSINFQPENSNLSTLNDEKNLYQNYFKYSKPKSRINLNS